MNEEIIKNVLLDMKLKLFQNKKSKELGQESGSPIVATIIDRDDNDKIVTFTNSKADPNKKIFINGYWKKEDFNCHAEHRCLIDLGLFEKVGDGETNFIMKPNNLNYSIIINIPPCHICYKKLIEAGILNIYYIYPFKVKNKEKKYQSNNNFPKKLKLSEENKKLGYEVMEYFINSLENTFMIRKFENTWNAYLDNESIYEINWAKKLTDYFGEYPYEKRDDGFLSVKHDLLVRWKNENKHIIYKNKG